MARYVSWLDFRRQAEAKGGLSRRDFLRLTGAGGALMALGSLPAQAQQAQRRIHVKSDAKLFIPASATNRSGRYWEYNSFITPVERFYVRNYAATPIIDKAQWRLKVYGDGVGRELELTYDDLLKLPTERAIYYMECYGNGRTLYWEQQNQNPRGSNWLLGAVGQAEWEYVPIGVILELAKVDTRKVRDVLFWSGVDTPFVGRPITIEEAVNRANEIGIAFSMNGDELPPDHGGPVRALVPGYGGAASTKWLTEVYFSAKRVWVPLNSYDQVLVGPDWPKPQPDPEKDYFRELRPDQVTGLAITYQNVKSFVQLPLVIRRSPALGNYPLQQGELPKMRAGLQVMRGYAHSPWGVRKVEYRIDGGPWRIATILPPRLGRYTWVRFQFEWEAKPGVHVIETRATDNHGNVQPERVPFDALGHMNNSIPRFEVEVV